METWAIITVSKNGVKRALDVEKHCRGKIGFHIYTLDKYHVHGITRSGSDLKKIIAEVYPAYGTILFIMASGIVVRMIAPFVRSKLEDPAVLVMDDKGEFVISLLSGHIGGGNEATRTLSGIIGATPVITTSSDVNGTLAVDTFAMRHNLHITDFTQAKEITAMILNGDAIALVNEEGISVEQEMLSSNVRLVSDIDHLAGWDGAIVISQREPIERDIPFVQLMSKNLVLGIGCKKNTPVQAIIDFIYELLGELGIGIDAISKLSTVDVKREEQGLLEASERLGLELDIISRGEIAKYEDKFKQSEFVKKTIGVGNVSEPCGYISSNRGTCILKRRAKNGITLSLWKKKEEA